VSLVGLGEAVESVKKGGEFGFPFCCSDFGVEDFFVSPSTFARGVFFAGGWELFGEVVGEALVTLELGDGGVVRDVKNAC